MSAPTLQTLWPYFLLIVAGFLPNEIWRWLGLAVAHQIDENSEILIWVRAVATAILAGVIAKLTVFSPGALAAFPLELRLGAIIVGFLGFLLIRRSVFAGVVTGQAAFILGALLFVRP